MRFAHVLGGGGGGGANIFGKLIRWNVELFYSAAAAVEARTGMVFSLIRLEAIGGRHC